MKYRILVLAVVLVMSGLSYAKADPIRITTITDATDPTSSEVMKAFRQHLSKYANLFTMVDNSRDEPGIHGKLHAAKSN